MIRYFFILFFILLGCTKKKTELPKGLLSRSQMVAILTDVHLLEAKVQKLYLSKDSASQVYHHFEKKLFEQQGINDSVYNASLVFYTDELQEFKHIYDEVVDSLLARQVALDMKISVDSTRKLKIVKDTLKDENKPLEQVDLDTGTIKSKVKKNDTVSK